MDVHVLGRRLAAIMTRRTIAIFSIVVSVFLLQPPGTAQLRVQPVAGQRGEVELALLLRKLQAGPTLMMTTAHPDDENNALLAQFDWGLGLRTTLVTATRGQGGQNEIGPELFDALAVLRTEELLAAHRFDGAEQFFTRAIDFGYSFSIEETLRNWGSEEILGDFVRHIRTIRPDVIVGFIWEGQAGGQHHQASARLTADAFRAAADPTRYPEQIQQGLRVWQAKKFYYTAGFGWTSEPPAGALIVDSSEYDPLLGRSYTEIGSQARSMHKCQGMSQLFALPGSAGRAYKLHDTVLPGRLDSDETALLDGVPSALVDYLMEFAPANAALRQRLEAVVAPVRAASRALTGTGTAAAVAPLGQGLTALRAVRKELDAMVPNAVARYEIDFRLAQKEQLFEEALGVAAGLRIEALSEDGLVVAGQDVDVNVVAANRGAMPVTVSSVALDGFERASGCSSQDLDAGAIYECSARLRVPVAAELTGIYFHRHPVAARYEFEDDVPFGAPFEPTPYRARIALRIGDTEITLIEPVQYRYQTDVFAGEKRTELLTVPAMSVRLSPDVLIVPSASANDGGPHGPPARDVRVTVINHRKGASQGQVRLALPQGWTSEPATATVSFTREDEAAPVRFSVRPPPGVTPGRFEVKAALEAGGATFDRGYRVVEYPHIQRRHVYDPALARATVIDVKVPQGITVGYIMGVGDEVPQALAQIGVTVEFIDSEMLAWGDLSKYGVIITGVRAYERRADLRANNQRLIDYAKQGGVVLVNYNKFEFNEAQYAPFPVRVGRGRITDERAPVTVLAPDHPIFTRPNRIGADVWENWVQERGLYFLETEGRSEYTDLIEMEDPFPYNRGARRGALVEAQIGGGCWIYLGLGLWRQLPAVTPGAYKLMANLIALGGQTN